MKTRAQTATEYLIILAVVIVIALIVVRVLGGIPSIGGGASESASRAALSSAEVGITGYSISPAKGFFRLQNNQANAIIVDSITIDGKECWLIGTNSNPSLTPRLRAGETKTISCGSITAESGDRFDYELSITYTDTSTNAQYTITDLQMVGSGASFECPDGFIPVPGGFVLADGSTVDDFCVMKYEAKAQVDANETIVADGGFSQSNNWGVATHTPVSVGEGRPWVKINQTNAISECQSLGSGYDLISDQQWMVLAENILNTEINDLVAGTAGPQLGNGNSNSAQSYAAGSDPVVSGCDLSQSLNTTANAFSSTCQLRGTNGNTADFGYTSDGSSNFGIAYNSGADSRAKLRTHVLSNGEVVWDLAGNVFDWTSTILPTTSSQFGVYYDGSPDFTGTEWMEPSQLRGSSFGFGFYEMYGSSNVVALRGGDWGNGGTAGAFFVSGDYDPSLATPDIGFRCVYSPGG